MREAHGAVPLRTVAFGPVGGEFDAEALLGVPRVAVDNANPTVSRVVSWEVHAAAPRPGTALTVRSTGPATTVLDTTEGGTPVRRLFHGVPEPGGWTFQEQATAAFQDLEQALASAGMEPRHITRTWFFLGRIADDYDCFNAVRNAFFDRWGLRVYPASTGIGARLPDPTLLSVLVEATSSAGANPAEPFGTALQCAPSAYGSRFVRANRVRHNGCRTVSISGVSSVVETGASLHRPNVADLVHFSMRSFTDLLGRGQVSFEDVCSSYVYCVDDRVRAAFEDYVEAHSLKLPYLLNHVDICRPDLVFEIEARAIRREGRREGRPA
jgi:enamine deaminase RidA (YjgF/YER057c/UK114 family)